MVMPERFVIGQLTQTDKHGMLKQVRSYGQYIPLSKTLPSSLEHMDFCIPGSSEGFISTHKDGKSFKDNTFFQEHPDTVCQALYHDDIEVGNPLGSRAGVNKLTMFYVTIQGLPAYKLTQILPVLICYASDVKSFGYDSVLKPLVGEFEFLKSGLVIKGKLFNVRLNVLIGDNLAANCIVGLNSSFNASYYCRFCIMHSHATTKATHMNADHLRTAAIHAEHIEAKSYGVKEFPAFDKISYFSSVTSTVPDIMHDILEGVGKREVHLLLGYLFANYTNLHEFNNRLKSMKYRFVNESINSCGTKKICCLQFMLELANPYMFIFMIVSHFTSAIAR
jgi:hypothetical protein